MPPRKAKQPLGAGTGRQQSQQQAQLIANPNATTSVKLTQSQSLKIVQTSIIATVSAILYIRNIFPGEHCHKMLMETSDYYQHRTYNLTDPNFGYKVTTDDARAMERQEKDTKTVSWDILVPGKHQHTDKVLLWLDGVGDAVQRKYLETLVISIHHSCISPDTVIDAYVMDFSYSTDGAPQVGISKGSQKLEVTGKDMSDMKTLFSRLLKMARQSGVITPNAPMIGLQLTYNNTCPEAYEPPGFRAAPASKVIEEGRGTEVGGFSLKHHRMLPVTSAPEVPREPLAANVDHGEETNSLQLQVETQTPGVRCEIVSMMVSENTVADTQLVGIPSRSMDKVPTPRPNTPQPVISINGPHLESTQRIFVVVESGGDGADALNILRNSDSTVPVPNVPGSSDCLCERQLDSDAMKCERCEKHQHRVCYGYLETDVLLNKFVCYDCLLQTKPGFLKEMRQMCQVRAMMWIIANEGYPRTESELAKRTGYLVKEARAASLQLLEEEYLIKVHRPNEKKGKALRKGRLPPPFKFNESKRAQLLEGYWNPAYLFGTHLKRIDSSDISNLPRAPQSSKNPTSPASVFSSMSPHPSSSQQVNQATKMNSARPQPKALAAQKTVPRSASPSDSMSYDDDDDLDAACSKGPAFDTMSLDDVEQGPCGKSMRPDVLDLDDDDDDGDDAPIGQRNMQVALSSSSEAGPDGPAGSHGSPATLKKRKLGVSADERAPAKRRTFVKSPFHVRH